MTHSDGRTQITRRRCPEDLCLARPASSPRHQRSQTRSGLHRAARWVLRGQGGREKGSWIQAGSPAAPCAKRQTPPPGAARMLPQKRRLCSVGGLLTVAQRAVGTRAGLRCTCCAAKMSCTGNLRQNHIRTPPPKKKNKKKIFVLQHHGLYGFRWLIPRWY